MRLKAKFFTASIVATGLDFGLYYLLEQTIFDPVTAHFVSYPIAVLLNFYLQKRFIFDMKRGLRTTFLLAMGVSTIGWFLGTGMMYLLVKIPVFEAQPIVAKGLVTFLLFFYNFYLKRFVFEKKLFSTD